MKTVIITILIALISTRTQAQIAPSDFPRWNISPEILTQTTGVYAESYRLPGMKTLLGGAKGFQFGVEYIYVAKNRGQLFQGAAVRKFSSGNETGLGASIALGYRWFIAKTYVEAQTGVGYLQTSFRSGRELQNSNGDFFTEKFRIAGLAPIIALGTGYRVNKKWKVYLRYDHHLQLNKGVNPSGVRLYRSLNLGAGWVI